MTTIGCPYQPLEGEIRVSSALVGVVNVGGINTEKYEGDYTVTPAPTRHILQTKSKLMAEDVVINPIPNEYGLITYNNDKTITIT